MRPTTAIALAAMDTQLTRNVGAMGGDVAGIPVIISANTPRDGDSPGDNAIVLIDASEIFMNEGGIEVKASNESTIEMESSPTYPSTSGVTLVSMFQQHLVAIMVQRYIRWARRTEGSVAMLTGVGY